MAQEAKESNDIKEEIKDNKSNSNNNQNSSELLSGSPSEIIVNELYLGDMNHSQNEKLLLSLGITHIVNVTMFKNWFPNKFKYLNIKVYDSSNEEIDKYFEQVIQFIDIALNEQINKDKDIQNKVFVHCAQGVSRSATFVIAYCMKKYLWTFDDGFLFVSRKRECIAPNKGFIESLKKFEQNNYEIKYDQDDIKESKDKEKEREWNKEFCETVKKYKCEDCDAILENNFQMEQHMKQTDFEHCMFDEV